MRNGEGKKSPQEFRDPIFGKVTAAMRRGDEDDAVHIWQWFDKDRLSQ